MTAPRITFRKTDEPYGWLHNMCRGYPIRLDPHVFKSSEALYQCFRFPGHPAVQRLILEASNGFAAKLVAKEHYHLTREDWMDEHGRGKNAEQVRVSCMRLAVELKFRQNLGIASQLHDLYGQEIVELSTKDPFWGARIVDGTIVGENWLGRLLMDVSRKLRGGWPLMYDEDALPLLKGL